MVDERMARYSVPAGISSPIIMKTEPGATCTLYAEDKPDQGLKLYADQEGVIRFHVRPVATKSDITAKFIIQCEVGDKTTQFPFELRVSSKPTAEIEASRESPQHIPRAASVRPALSEQDMLHLSDEELLKRGYPLRPSPEAVPEAFRAWQRTVSVPMTNIEPQTVSRPDIVNNFASIVEGPKSSNNWSGFELRDNGPYGWVVGDWIVPFVTGESSTKTYSSFWVGLDGDSTSDLVQAGTGHENVEIDVIFPNGLVVPWSFSTYYAWTEFLPQQSNTQQVTNFPINPGDEMH